MVALRLPSQARSRADAPTWMSRPRGELARAGVAVARLLDGALLERLRAEAFAVHVDAVETRVDLPHDAEAGDPDRWLESATGGPELQAFYQSPRVLQLLYEQTGVVWQTSGSGGSFSYYRREGHHLGLHRDIDVCELAAITCVVDEAGGHRDDGGLLRLYPSRRHQTIPEIRRSPEAGLISVRLEPGQTLLLVGGLIPHRLMPLGRDHLRIIAPLCYRVAEQ